MCMETGLCRVLSGLKRAFLTSFKSKRSNMISFWRVLAPFRVVYCANFLNIGYQNGVT